MQKLKVFAYAALFACVGATPSLAEDGVILLCPASIPVGAQPNLPAGWTSVQNFTATFKTYSLIYGTQGSLVCSYAVSDYNTHVEAGLITRPLPSGMRCSGNPPPNERRIDCVPAREKKSPQH